MMNYVEYLRVMRGLRIIAVIMGLLILGAIILRITTFHAHTWDDSVTKISNSRTAHTTKIKLPDGSTKTIIDDPAKRTHAEIIDRGYAGKEIVVTQPSRHGDEEHVTIGSVSVNQNQSNGVEHVRVKTNDNINVGWLMLGSLPWMLLFASLVAGALAKENDGHLELAWTQPVSRTTYALRTIATDFAGIIVVAIMSMLVFLICAAFFQLPHLTVDAAGLRVSAICLLAAFSFYALVAAVTSSLKFGPGLIIGIVWAVIAVLPALIQIDGPPGSVWHVLGVCFRDLNHLNPLSYVAHAVYMPHDEPELNPATVWSPFILLGLTLVYLAAALVQWRRVEA